MRIIQQVLSTQGKDGDSLGASHIVMLVALTSVCINLGTRLAFRFGTLGLLHGMPLCQRWPVAPIGLYGAAPYMVRLLHHAFLLQRGVPNASFHVT